MQDDRNDRARISTRRISRLIWAITLLFLVMVVALLTQQVQAQDVRVAKQRGPHYVGDRVLVRVSLTNFDESPQPEVEVSNVSQGLQFQFAGVRPNVSESVTIINGRMSKRRTVVFHYDYYVSVKQPGDYSMGPFQIVQNGKEYQGEEVPLRFETVPEDPDLRIRVITPEKPVYPGQEAPVRVELTYKGRIQDLLLRSLSIQSPLFEKVRFDQQQLKQGREYVPIIIRTADGDQEIAAQYEKRQVEGVEAHVLYADRIMRPKEPGQFDFGPALATVPKVTRWERSFFSTEPADAVRIRAVGDPVRLTVKPLPVAGRPASFSGAIGTGFSLQAQAERTVVRVGDPISIDVAVQGAGDLTQVGFPDLSRAKAWDPQRFRLPEQELTGQVRGNTKQFSLNVRVLDESVQEIPAIEFSWFDPQRESYQVAQSQPIALRVNPAQVIGAGDVVTSPQASRQNDDSSRRQSAEAESRQPTRQLALANADLSVETDLDQLQKQQSSTGSRFQLLDYSLYALGLSLIALVIWQKRAERIPEPVRQRRQILQQQRKQLEASTAGDTHEQCTQMANALRSLLAGVDDAPRPAIERLIAEIETIIYSPDPASYQGLADLRQRAIDIVQALQAKSVESGSQHA